MKQHIIIALITAACTVALWSCGGSRKAVTEQGSTDARTLIENFDHMTRHQIEEYLFQVRANESVYREQGKDKEADIYLQAFETYMRENADSLAHIIFDNAQTASDPK